METRASYILVGSFVLGLIAAAFAFVVWLASVQFEDVPKRYLIYFDGSVTGLAVASPVRYRGVPVGSVVDIRIDPENIERILVTPRFPPRRRSRPIPRRRCGSRASPASGSSC